MLKVAVLIAFIGSAACSVIGQKKSMSDLSAESEMGDTKLEIPLVAYHYVNNRQVNIPIVQLNLDLKKKGVAGLPEIAVIGKNPGPFYKLIEKRAVAASDALKINLHLNLLNDRNIYDLDICYRGSAKGIPGLITAMMGNFLNQDQGILAIASGPNKIVYDDAFNSRSALKKRFEGEYENHLESINRWLKYDKKSSTALVMSDYGQNGDGTELEVTEIAPCK